MYLIFHLAAYLCIKMPLQHRTDNNARFNMILIYMLLFNRAPSLLFYPHVQYRHHRQKYPKWMTHQHPRQPHNVISKDAWRGTMTVWRKRPGPRSGAVPSRTCTDAWRRARRPGVKRRMTGTCLSTKSDWSRSETLNAMRTQVRTEFKTLSLFLFHTLTVFLSLFELVRVRSHLIPTCSLSCLFVCNS